MSEIKIEEQVVSMQVNGQPPVIAVQETVVQTTAESPLWDKIIRGLVYATAFLLPLLFTPWTMEPLELSKQMLLYAAMSAALIIWLLKLLVLRSFRFIRTPLDLPIVGLLGIYLLASVFSVDRSASFLGAYGTFTENFFQILFMVVFYYLVVNNFQTPAQLRKLFKVFMASVLLALVYTVLQFFGLFIVPSALTKTASFNTLGSLLILTLFSAFAVVISLGMQARSWFKFPAGLIWRILLALCAFLVLLTINFLYAWVALIAGLLLYIVLHIATNPTFNMRSIVAPLVILAAVVSLLTLQLAFQVTSFRTLFRFDLPVEVRLDYGTAAPAIKGTIGDRPILGSGPGTFQYAFTQYRDQAFNLSPFWSARFDRSPSEASDYLVGSGILGFLAFEIFNLIFILYAITFMWRNRTHSHWELSAALLSSFAVLWTAHWFFIFNSVLLFSYWLVIAGFITVSRMSSERTKVFSFSFSSSPRQTVAVVSTASLGLVMIIVFLFFSSSVYAADFYYRKALTLVANSETFDNAEPLLVRAVKMNRFRSDYQLAYAEYLLGRINRELSKENPNVVQIQSWLASSINTARAAVALSPASGVAWERLANLYSFARPLIGGVDKFIIDSLVQAIEKDKQNPVLHTELGQAYQLTARSIDPGILGRGSDADLDGLSDDQEKALGSNPAVSDSNGNKVADGNEVLAGLNPAGQGQLPEEFVSRYVKVNQENIVKAIESFRKAIELKEDYAVAYYQLALTLEQSGEEEQAMAELENALGKLPGNLTFKFELGRLYFNANKVSEAARQFQEILAVTPNHANSLFSLAVCYERLGNLAGALDQYRKVSELNPDNKSIAAKVTQLERAVAAQ